MTKIIDSNEWQDLKKHFDDIKNVQMRDLFKDDKQRFEKFHLTLDDFLFDFSKNRINDKTLGLLNKLAIKADVEGWRAKQFSGEKINTTEDRAVLHSALRSQDNNPVVVDGVDVKPEVLKVLNSAIANAENNFGLDIDKLVVSEAYVGKSIVMKRMRARARGRAARILKPFSKLTILLKEIEEGK